MIAIETYMAGLIAALRRDFAARLRYVGLQGSYLRGEADEHSDIDVMVLLDPLTVGDLAQYRRIVCEAGDSDKACGFISGVDELRHWNPCEIAHLVHTTKDYVGRLADYVPPYTAQDERRYIQISLDNLYHALCHRYIHASRDDNRAALPGCYKAVFFILQDLHYQRTGRFVQTKRDLLAQLEGDDREVLQRAMDLRQGADYDFAEAYTRLFNWCQKTICTV